ncbi:MAG TPA: 1,4-alpha-glucan branching protein GlgB [Woeseiaceae bacterium]|nr:1,4-alpha-glucan branching protein GlgB [Woeseiaceae bacterium]
MKSPDAEPAPGRSALDALAEGRHSNPFALLGPHPENGVRRVRCLLPLAASVSLIDRKGNVIAAMERIHEAGIYTATLPARCRSYRLRVSGGSGEQWEIEDPYRFPSTLGELDLYLLGEGSHREIYRKLGSQCMKLLGVRGTRFAVWAPNARRVSVIGDFNDWDGRRHVMRLHPGNGIWEIFLPQVDCGAKYKFELLDRAGNLLPLKSDPYAHYFEAPPNNASIIYQSRYRWTDQRWMSQRSPVPALDRPLSIYEVHLGSWRRNTLEGNRPLSYREHARELIDYVTDLGFTHIELLPVTEHPFDGSWGYQTTGLYAPTQRFGEPDDFRYLVDRCHEAGLGVIIDWVPAHFPRDEHGLRRFDGTALYEHEDPRKGEHADWGTLIFNFGRREIINYLIGSALYWIDEFHIDALRVDAVASMLYLDYSRKDGEWLPNELGGNENLEAIDFLRHLNREVHLRGAITFAEESTAWPGVSRPVEYGGLGFTYKWNMGWMNDTLSYMAEDPVHRRYHHDKMTFGLVYAFNENFVLPLSHDEVVHGKRSLLGRMPGDEWQKFANLRAYLALMYCHPGKKLLFMGAELAQWQEWSHERSLDWHLLHQPLHGGMQKLVRDLNRLYRATPALHQVDFDPQGFEWIDWQDRDASVLAWLRRDRIGNFVVCVANLTPVVRYHYAVGVPRGGPYIELFNSDAAAYGGSNSGNAGRVEASPQGSHGRPYTLLLTLPPLATLVLGPAEGVT